MTLHPNEGRGFVRVLPKITSLRIDETLQGGRRLIINDDGRDIIFDFTADQADFLAGLLARKAAT